jgi:hypothetical protein
VLPEVENVASHRRNSEIAGEVAGLHALWEDFPVTAGVEEVNRMVVTQPMITGSVMFSSSDVASLEKSVC